MNFIIYFFKLNNSLHILKVVCFFSAFDKNKLKFNKDIFSIFKIVGFISFVNKEHPLEWFVLCHALSNFRNDKMKNIVLNFYFIKQHL